jgi:hypothetical protein
LEFDISLDFADSILKFSARRLPPTPKRGLLCPQTHSSQTTAPGVPVDMMKRDLKNKRPPSRVLVCLQWEVSPAAQIPIIRKASQGREKRPVDAPVLLCFGVRPSVHPGHAGFQTTWRTILLPGGEGRDENSPKRCFAL